MATNATHMPGNYVLAPCNPTLIWHVPTQKLKGEPCCRNASLYKYLLYSVYPITLRLSKIGTCFESYHELHVLDNKRDAVLSSLYLFYCQVTLHVSGVFRTHHQEYTNCSYNHWYSTS